jgi:hypothetical protein
MRVLAAKNTFGVVRDASAGGVVYAVLGIIGAGVGAAILGSLLGGWILFDPAVSLDARLSGVVAIAVLCAVGGLIGALVGVARGARGRLDRTGASRARLSAFIVGNRGDVISTVLAIDLVSGPFGALAGLTASAGCGPYYCHGPAAPAVDGTSSAIAYPVFGLMAGVFLGTLCGVCTAIRQITDSSTP